ncbi:S41 family peptidase [Pedobacter zeae]|nr:S41 family peptidase [Pedobacter zeae]MBB4106602.1 C-terminal processing protease CtpA/Prc [Pedobacter zeae]
MKNKQQLIVVIITVIIFFKNFAFAQGGVAKDNTIKLNTEILNIIKKNSMFSDKLNWKQVNEESKILPFTTNDSLNEKIIYNFYTQKLREVGDRHSFFVTNKVMEKFREKPLVDTPAGKYLGEGIAWLKIPAILSFDGEKELKYANDVRGIIKKIDTDNTITGWIVDLRQNTGGNMWPMLAGLNALVEDGTAGYFVEGKTGKKYPWQNKNGILLGKGQVVDTYKSKNRNVKIAILIDSRTASSGEMTAISFLGLPNVKSFGQTSAGYTTANYTFVLSNGTQLQLAKTYVADRTGKGYPKNVEPDVSVEPGIDSGQDKVILSASTWLKSK